MTDWNAVLSRQIRKLMRRGESEEDAKDLVQEASLRLLEYMMEKEVNNKEAFMERTANNLAIDRYRHAQRYPMEKDDIHHLEHRLPPVHPGRNPHEVWVADKRLIEVRTALNKLRDRTGDVFFAQLAGYSYRELAAAFGLSESAIEKRIALAMMWLMDQKE